MCDYEHGECPHLEQIGYISGGAMREGFMNWRAVASYEDASDDGMYSKRCFTRRGALRAATKMAAHLAQVRVAVLTAQMEGK